MSKAGNWYKVSGYVTNYHPKPFPLSKVLPLPITDNILNISFFKALRRWFFVCLAGLYERRFAVACAVCAFHFFPTNLLEDTIQKVHLIRVLHGLVRTNHWYLYDFDECFVCSAKFPSHISGLTGRQPPKGKMNASVLAFLAVLGVFLTDCLGQTVRDKGTNMCLSPKGPPPKKDIRGSKNVKRRRSIRSNKVS